MKFILTSNSYLVTKHWAKEFGLSPKKMKVAFIDTAAEVYNKAEAVWLKADRQSMVDVGFDVSDYTLTDKTKDQLKKELATYDVLFVSGGNTFYLLEKANNSGFTELIKENYFRDKVYVGSSAGSVLLSSDIDPIQFLDDPKKATLSSTKAIALFNFVLFPHWGNEKFEQKYLKALDHAYKHTQAAFLLSDDQYVLASADFFQLVSIR